MLKFIYLVFILITIPFHLNAIKDIYIDNSGAAGGDGSISKPFSTIQDAAGASGSFEFPLTFHFKGTGVKYSASYASPFGNIYPEIALRLTPPLAELITEFKTWEGSPIRAILELGKFRVELDGGMILKGSNIDFVNAGSFAPVGTASFQSFNSENQILLTNCTVKNYKGTGVMFKGEFKSLNITNVTIDSVSLPIINSLTVIKNYMRINQVTLIGVPNSMTIIGAVANSLMDIEFDSLFMPNPLENQIFDIKNALKLAFKNISIQSKAQIKVTNAKDVTIDTLKQIVPTANVDQAYLLTLDTVSTATIKNLVIDKTFSSAGIISLVQNVNSVYLANVLSISKASSVTSYFINQLETTALSLIDSNFTNCNFLIIKQTKVNLALTIQLVISNVTVKSSISTGNLFEISDGAVNKINLELNSFDSAFYASLDGSLSFTEISLKIGSTESVNSFLKAATKDSNPIKSMISIDKMSITGAPKTFVFDLKLLDSSASISLKNINISNSGAKDSLLGLLNLLVSGTNPPTFQVSFDSLTTDNSFINMQTSGTKIASVTNSKILNSYIRPKLSVSEEFVLSGTIFDNSFIENYLLDSPKLTFTKNTFKNLKLTSIYIDVIGNSLVFQSNTVDNVNSDACTYSFLKFSGSGSLLFATNSFSGSTPFFELKSSQSISITGFTMAVNSNCPGLIFDNQDKEISIKSSQFSDTGDSIQQAQSFIVLKNIIAQSNIQLQDITLNSINRPFFSGNNLDLTFDILNIDGASKKASDLTDGFSLIDLTNSRLKISNLKLQNSKLLNFVKTGGCLNMEFNTGTISSSDFAENVFQLNDKSEAIFKSFTFKNLGKINTNGQQAGLAILAQDSFVSIQDTVFQELTNYKGGTAVYIIQSSDFALNNPTYPDTNTFLQNCAFKILKTDLDGAAIVIDSPGKSTYYHSIFDDKMQLKSDPKLEFSENESPTKTDIALYSLLTSESLQSTFPTGIVIKNDTNKIEYLDGAVEHAEMFKNFAYSLSSSINKVSYKGQSSFMPDMLDPEFTVFEPESGLFCTNPSIIPPPPQVRRRILTEVTAEESLFTLLRDSLKLEAASKDPTFNCNSYINAANYWRTNGSKVSATTLKAELAKLKTLFISEFKKSNIFLKKNVPLDKTNRCYDEQKSFKIVVPPSPVKTETGFDLGHAMNIETPGETTWYLITRSGILKDQATGNPNNQFIFQGEVYFVLPIVLKSNCKCTKNQNQYLLNGVCTECPLDCTDCRKMGICKKCVNEKEPVANLCTCDSGFYISASLKKCDVCDQKCKECSGPTYKECNTCPNNADTFEGICTCFDGEFLDKPNKKCSKCSTKCSTCSGAQDNNCLICPDGKLSDSGLCSCDGDKIVFNGQCLAKEEAFSKVDSSTVTNTKSVQEVKSAASLISQVLKANSSSLTLNDNYDKETPCGDNSRCTGNGVCQGNIKCVCNNGFSGSLCQYKTESLQQITALSDQVTSQLLKLTDPAKATPEEAKNAIDTIATLSENQDALSTTSVKNVIGLLEGLLNNGKLAGQTKTVLSTYDNLLQAVNNYPISMSADDRKTVAQRAMDGFSKAIESDLKTNKESLAKGDLTYNTSSVQVTTSLKDFSSTSTGRRYLQSASSNVNIPADTLKAIANNNKIIVQIEVWSENPKNTISSQEISSNVYSIKVLKYNDLSILSAKNLTNPIKLTLSRKFGSQSANDTCFYFNENTKTWDTDGVDMTSNSDTTIECSTTHLTAFGAGMKGKAVVLITNVPDSNNKNPTTGQVINIVPFFTMVLFVLLMISNQ